MSSLFDGMELPAAADFHVHLRDGDMMHAVTPTIRQGGVDTVFVMPNLIPPLTTVEAVLSYRSRLQAIEPNVQYCMSLYLHPDITPSVIHAASHAGITGVKSYPAGVTTNSSSGVVDYESFYPVFAAMEQVDMVLNLHGESPPHAASETDPARMISVLNAEASFLPTLQSLHSRFPNLRIVLEHCTTAAAVEAVLSCGPNVVGTITAHHLFLTIDDWAGDPINFCKPVAKTPSDRIALLKAATGGSKKFFFGSDSAPHLLSAKKGLTDGGLGAGKCAAGVFTQPDGVGFVLEAFEAAKMLGIVRDVGRETVEGFLGGFGREFYKVGPAEARIRVKAKGATVQNVVVKNSASQSSDGGSVHGDMGSTVVTFRSGKETYSVEWL